MMTMHKEWKHTTWMNQDYLRGVINKCVNWRNQEELLTNM